MIERVPLVIRVLAAAVVASAAGLAVASPAQAHPEISVSCDPVPNSRHSCVVFIRGAEPSRTIRWFIGGVRISDLDDRITFVRGCARGRQVGAKAVVTDANGSDSAGDAVICGDITP